jgi:hypothetical protein
MCNNQPFTPYSLKQLRSRGGAVGAGKLQGTTMGPAPADPKPAPPETRRTILDVILRSSRAPKLAYRGRDRNEFDRETEHPDHMPSQA